jgi:hypothetical protein
MSHKEMMDNRKVHDNHQQGIERVKQRKGDMHKGQGGKMHERPSEQAHWSRKGDSLTPRRA